MTAEFDISSHVPGAVVILGAQLRLYNNWKKSGTRKEDGNTRHGT